MLLQVDPPVTIDACDAKKVPAKYPLVRTDEMRYSRNARITAILTLKKNNLEGYERSKRSEELYDRFHC